MQHRAILVNPPIYDFAAYDLFTKPLGLLHLGGLLQRAGFDVRLVDALDRRHPLLTERYGPPKVKHNGTGKYHTEVISKPAVLSHIPRTYRRYGLPEDLFLQAIAVAGEGASQPIVLVSSMMTYWWPAIADAICLVREVFPKATIALGGVYASLMPDHARRHCMPDQVFPGTEPGKLFTWLEELLGVSGIKDNYCRVEMLKPDYDLYNHPLDYLTLITSVGCPFHCDYCASGRLWPELRQFPPEQMIEQITRHVHKINEHGRAKNIAFIDDALLVHSEQHFEPLFTKIASLGLNFRFHAPNGLHCRFITDNVARLMYENRFEMIRLSYEAADARWQTAGNGKVSDQSFTTAVERLVKAGYAPHELQAYILAGLPGQTLDEVAASARRVHQLGLMVRLCQYSPIPGTPLFKQTCRDYGIDPNEPLLHNNSVLPVFAQTVGFEQFEQFKAYISRENQRFSAASASATTGNGPKEASVEH
ncbi:MAG: radical SAM protein [Sedimentisphaerales bacterium]|nr:radical SAM protein [Sedimentisphaerales bacterium]